VSTPRDDAAQVAYDASVHALQSQEDQLGGLQTRASFLLAASGIATGTVLSRPTIALHGVGLVSVMAFGGAAVLATIVIAPRFEAWRFTANATTIIDAVAARPALTTVEVMEWLARTNQANYARNKGRLDSLYTLLSLGCVALVLAIVLTVVTLAKG